MKKRIVILLTTVCVIASVITGCDPQTNGTSNQSVESVSSISQSTSKKEEKSSETSKEDEIRPAIKQKIDKAYETSVKADKAYSDWKKKYGDGKNVSPSQVATAQAEADSALALIEESSALSEELVEMAKNGELNVAEMKYYMEKLGDS